MARKRRFSEESFGPTIERLMGESGLTYRSLAEKTKLSAGYLNHLVHGNRPVPSDDVIKTLARALGVEHEAPKPFVLGRHLLRKLPERHRRHAHSERRKPERLGRRLREERERQQHEKHSHG